jgi:hypothetical protein
MWWKPYEELMERKPVEARVAIRDLLAKDLAETWAAFPPDESTIDWLDEHLARRLRGRVHELPRLSPDVADLVARLVTLDLTHEQAAIDHLFRNDHHRVVCPRVDDVDALHLLWRHTTDTLLQRREDCAAITRADLVTIVNDAAARFRRDHVRAQNHVQ